MGEQKRLKGKQIPKHETEANWLLSSYVPEQGEMVIYDIDSAHTYERQKIGNGVQTVNELPFSGIRPLADLLREEGKNREYLIKAGAELIQTTECSVSVPKAKGFMVRACKSSTEYGWFSFIGETGYPVENPEWVIPFATAIPKVTRTDTTATWEPVDGANYYEYLIGDVVKYHSSGSFMDVYNSVYVEMSRGRGLYGAYALTASAASPKTPEPDRYADGKTLDSIPLRLGDTSGEHPEYVGHIQVPREIVMPEGATQSVKDKINSFATSKYYVDQQDLILKEELNQIKNNLKVEEQGEIPLIIQTEPGVIPFEAKHGLYARATPQNCQDYEDFALGTDSWIELGSTSDIAYTDAPTEGAGLSLQNDISGKALVYKIAEVGKGNNGKIFFGKNQSYEGKKFIFETDVCVNRMNTTDTSNIKWCCRFHLRDKTSLSSTSGRIWDSSANGGNLQLQYSSGSGIHMPNCIPSKKIQYGEWFNLRFEQIGTDLKIYINHELVGQRTTTKNINDGISCVELQGRKVAYDSEILFDNTCMFMNDDDFFGGQINPPGIAGRLLGGYINVPKEPINDEHAASKKYVDNSLNRIDFIEVGEGNPSKRALRAKSIINETVEAWSPNNFTIDYTIHRDSYEIQNPAMPDELVTYYELWIDVTFSEKIPAGNSVMLEVFVPDHGKTYYIIAEGPCTKKQIYPSSIGGNDADFEYPGYIADHMVELGKITNADYTYKSKIEMSAIPNEWHKATTIYAQKETSDKYIQRFNTANISAIEGNYIYVTDTINTDYKAISSDIEIPEDWDIGVITLTPIGVIFGDNNRGSLNYNVFVHGHDNIFGNCARIIGNHIVNYGKGLIVGEYNLNTDGLFVVGAGDSTKRKDAIVVTTDGTTYINGSIPAKQEALDETNTELLTLQEELDKLKGTLTYELSANGKYYIVTGRGTVTGSELVIPNTHEGKPVRRVADNAFQNGCEDVTKLTLGKYCECVGYGNIYNMTNLTELYTNYDVELAMGDNIPEGATYACLSATIAEGVGNFSFDFASYVEGKWVYNEQSGTNNLQEFKRICEQLWPDDENAWSLWIAVY